MFGLGQVGVRWVRPGLGLGCGASVRIRFAVCGGCGGVSGVGRDWFGRSRLPWGPLQPGLLKE